MMPLVLHAMEAIGLALLLGAALHDIAVRTVPNCISALVAILGVASRVLEGDILPALIVATLVFVVAVVLWLRGWMGGADAKLLGAAALLSPPGRTLDLLLMIALCGGVLALFYLVASYGVTRPAHGRRATFFGRLAKAERWRLSRRGPLPYATAIAGGSVISLFSFVAG